jgi:hypothetical protein
MHRLRGRLAPIAAILAGIGAGCDGRPSVDSSTTEATVSGTILVRGKPATGGEILFNPANVDRPVGPRSAPIGKDGTYTIKTYTGGNQVGFAGSLATENPGLFRFKQYYEVQKGENKKDFDLLNGSEAPAGPTKSFGKKGR